MEIGDQEWFDKEKELGTESWSKLHKEMIGKYAANKDSIEGVRIR
jgi:hypothetical protein